GRCRSRFVWADRRRRRDRSDPWPGSCDRARSNRARWSGRHRCGRSKAYRALGLRRAVARSLVPPRACDCAAQHTPATLARVETCELISAARYCAAVRETAPGCPLWRTAGRLRALNRLGLRSFQGLPNAAGGYRLMKPTIIKSTTAPITAFTMEP